MSQKNIINTEKFYGIISFFDEKLKYGYIQKIDNEKYKLISEHIKNSDNEIIINEIKKTSDDNYKVYYFNIDGIKNLNDYENKNLVGALVDFYPVHNKDNPTATNITINHLINDIANSKEWNIYSTSYVQCQNCKKIMVPTITSNLNQPLYAICPLCGNVYRDLRSDKYKFREKMLPILFIIFVIISIASFILNK